MPRNRLIDTTIQQSDLDFLLERTATDVSDRVGLKKVLETDPDVRNAFLTKEELLRALMSDDEVLVRLSPAFFFEILLRNAAKQMGRRSYTLEKSGGLMTVPVFDSQEMLGLLRDEGVLMYLAHMLSTFTRLESYTYTFRIGPGVWRKLRFNDMDLKSLLQFAGVVDENYRMGLYKRIGDLCLFLLGMFPNYISTEYRYPFSGKRRPAMPGHPRLSPSEYERKGRQFYRKAAEHDDATNLEIADIFWQLHTHFKKIIFGSCFKNPDHRQRQGAHR